jgi:hypothetical protein
MGGFSAKKSRRIQALGGSRLTVALVIICGLVVVGTNLGGTFLEGWHSLTHSAPATESHPSASDLQRVPSEIRDGAPPSPPIPAAVTYSMVSRTYPGTIDVYGLASNNTTALLDLFFSNQTNRLVLFNAATNTSKVIQKVVPGGNHTSLLSVTSAGGAFFLVWENTTTLESFYQKVTLTGKITYPTLPIGKSVLWGFVYGNSTRLYASSGKFLVEINATSLKLVANYTKLLPSNLSLSSVLPVGNRLYLGGERSLANGATNAYFGFLNLSSKKVTTISKTIKNYPSDQFGAFLTLAARGTSVYVGGAIETFLSSPLTVGIDQGLFYQFVPSTSAFKNLSSLLPVRSWGVWGIEPWAKTIALSLTGFFLNNTITTFGGGTYTLSAGPGLVNETSIFPAGFLSDFSDETSASNGWYFSGGFNSNNNLGEAAAVKT